MSLSACKYPNIPMLVSSGSENITLDKFILKSYKKFGDAIYQPKFISTDDHEMLLSTGQMINLFGFGFSRDKGSYSK